MKKIFSVLMIVVVVISLVGCGNKISSEVKNTMSEYESLCDEYCEVVKKATSGNNSIPIGDLTALTTKLNDLKAKVQKLMTKDLSEAEKSYILEVSERNKTKVQAAMDSLKGLT